MAATSSVVLEWSKCRSEYRLLDVLLPSLGQLDQSIGEQSRFHHGERIHLSNEATAAKVDDAALIVAVATHK
jgi:hypothetical protein